MRLGIKLQSVSDIITNSSSEVFVVKATTPVNDLVNLIEQVANKNYFDGDWNEWEKLSDEERAKYDSSSGMGGDLEIMTFDDYYNQHVDEYIPENKRELFTKEVYSLQFKESLEELEKFVWVDIDHSRRATINWLLNNLEVVTCDSYCRIDPETKRVIEVVSYSEWKELPENERN